MIKRGFTLAEVLITLTIIGVIAAITIPNLMQSWRRHERITQVKEAYAILSNAIKMSVLENGSTNNWDYTGQNYKYSYTEYVFKTYLIPYLKTQKVSQDTRNIFYSYKNITGGVTNLYLGAILNNGMMVSYEHDTPNDFMIFVFDVNGKKGPNMLGNDVFKFGVRISTGEVTGWVSRPYPSYNGPLSQVMQYCCSSTNCTCCAKALILKNWQFPDDYPVKKF